MAARPIPEADAQGQRVLEGSVDWDAVDRREELSKRELRLRMMLSWGALAFLAFVPVNVAFSLLRETGVLVPMVLVHLLGVAPLAVVLLYLRARSGLGVRELMTFDVLATSGVAASIAILAAYTGGIESPIVAGLAPILVARGIAIADPWQRGLKLTSVPALVFWVVLPLALWLDPARELSLDRGVLAVLVLQLAITVVTAALVVLGGHLTWSLRRQLVQAQQVGRYELLRPLGQGGMGEVWAAWHQGLRQQVAIKLLPFATRDADMLERFEREVLATTKLQHPNTVRVYDFGRSVDGLWYYVMELLEGETLAELVAREGPLPPERALTILRQSARAIAEAHALGIVHRDLKPENLMVGLRAGEHDFVKVLDFGIASFVEVQRASENASTEPSELATRTRADVADTGARPTSRTNSARTIGTPLYLAPEAALGREISSPADVYALGCVLFFMLTGRPPFIDADSRALLRAHAEQPPPRASELLGVELPSYVEALLTHCLMKDPKRRPADARALAEAIDRCLRLAEDDLRRGTLRPQARARIEAGVLPKAQTETDISLLD